MTISNRSAVDGTFASAPPGDARTVIAATVAGRHSDVSVRRLVLILGQLAGLLALIYAFNLESQAFFRLSVLTVAGFSIHYFLPLQRRLPFFVALSFAGLALVLGITQAAWLIALGLMLIGISHLPIPIWARAVVLCAVGLALAVPRWGLGQVPWSAAIWPILGSMFIFRMIIYLYDRSHETSPPRWSQTLGYFFLLPNVCFPLFPVVDFKKFCRNYYDEERHRIYQIGVEWMWRGLIQLVLYRLVYYHLTVDSVAVDNLGDLAVYMLSTFLLYVRISGHFHLVIGMLHLFGFRLPETHHRYFLASSFTDFWRRINVYWKDFMLKVFYYPAFFRLRRMGETKALVIATAFTFVVTWTLHLGQWFWIRGSVLIEWNDIIFWTVFGLLVMVNSVYETRRGRKRTLKRALTLGESAGLVLRTLGTFLVICTLWSFWTAESVTDWWLMMSNAMRLPPWNAAQFAALGVGVIGLSALSVYAVYKGWGAVERGAGPHVAPLTVFATSLALCLLTVPAIANRTGEGELIASLQSSSLNRRDAEQFQRGYYENLLDVGKFNNELQRVYQNMPADFVRSLSALGLSKPTGDEQDYELVPNKEGRFVGEIVRTNSQGLRDREYAQVPPKGTYRIALLGPSTAMGSGVRDDETFEALLEKANRSAESERFEVLNFGVAGYSPFHMLVQLDKKVAAFEPHMAIFLGHVSDIEGTARYATRLLQRGAAPSNSFLAELAVRTGIEPETGPNEARRRMLAHRTDLLLWVYRQFVVRCREHRITPVFVYMQTVTEPAEKWREQDRAQILKLAAEAGFTVLDLTGSYDGYAPSELWIAPNDGHPNALGSRLLSERLYSLLGTHRTELGLAAAR